VLAHDGLARASAVALGLGQATVPARAKRAQKASQQRQPDLAGSTQPDLAGSTQPDLAGSRGGFGGSPPDNPSCTRFPRSRTVTKGSCLGSFPVAQKYMGKTRSYALSAATG
jgi:hypothetical protein